MADYKPPTRFDTTVELLVPQYSSYNGVQKKTYPKEGVKINCSFRTFGGSEMVINGVYSVVDTATIETWYNPLIRADCMIRLGDAEYEILGSPEDINNRHQFHRFKVRRTGGGA